MKRQKRIDDYGIRVGRLERGKWNKITDVAGVRVGHSTIDTKENKTGVTIILPHKRNVFTEKCIAASYVLNGFGKTAGLIQLDELGTLESPIALTNTLNVGVVHDSIIEYMIYQCKRDNIMLKSINPIICECNDSKINNIQNRVVDRYHVNMAIKSATENFLEGDIGAGKGLSCFQLKGGIGSASRIVYLEEKKYTVGVLVQSNMGLLQDLTIDGQNIGSELEKKIELNSDLDKGSIIIILATDIPLDSRQLKRLCKRTSVGLSRLGSFISNGSGEIVIGFTTSNIIKEQEKNDIVSLKVINEARIDAVFRAVAEACEEAILNSMVTAKQAIGIHGNIVHSLKDFMHIIPCCRRCGS